jgi:hypothetical protein
MRGPVVSILIVNWNTRERVMRVSPPFRDVQLARSFVDRGFTLWVTPSARVIHDAHSSIGCLAHPGKQQYLGSVFVDSDMLSPGRSD